MISFGRTDKGIVRDINEDFIYFNDNEVGMLPNLYIVSDGMGGHNAGEVASSLTVNSFVDYIKANNFDSDEFILDFLVNAANYANNIVYEKSKVSSDCQGMGATLSACTFVNGKIYFVHAGDSRIYLINNFAIKQLSIDHTYVNEMLRIGKLTYQQAKSHPQKNIITRAIGIDKYIEMDAFVSSYNFDDCFLICSDGLSSMLDDKEIFDIIKNNPSSIDNKISELISMTSKKGGFDNISVIFICEVQ